ncbi:substrate-binding domain-containing protein [Porcipelethomonas sp.]|uniref:substrate-binding domain-containing protein n=1 Tax=Porcipelethomonas sp. TaxID=2981675 RepID=UPI003EFAD116
MRKSVSMKKTLAMIMSLSLISGIATGCGSESFDAKKDITIVSREDGSGTRGAFVELFGIEEKDENGEKIDRTIDSAQITNNTSVMMTTVSGNMYAIGYISLGSLNDTVKAVKIDGVEATAENVKAGTYKIARPFNIAYKEDSLSDVSKDFIDYIMSTEGQQIVTDNGYISIDGAQPYSGSKPEGKIVVAGSSSVSPVMEKLKEAYMKVNTGADIEIQTSDSTTGMTSAGEGVCDIGMASRELKDSELETGLTPLAIAIDGIAVVVNNDNPVEDISSDTIKSIYVGETKTWETIAE